MKRITKRHASPFSTGGGGTRFEWLVDTSYVVALLHGENARGLSIPGVVIEVRFQQKTSGYPVDDIVIVSASGTRRSKLALQIKHNIRFTKNDLFCHIMAECWNHFAARTFDEERDFVGIAIGEACNITKLRTHVQDLLEWARNSARPQSFYSRVLKFSEKQKCLDVFVESLLKGLNRQVPKVRLWRFLRRFVIIPFDFDHPSGRDAIECWNKIQSLVPRGHIKNTKALFDTLYQLVSRCSTAGGEIDFDMLRQEVLEFLPLSRVPGIRTLRAALAQQVRRQLEREKQSKRYIPDVFSEIQPVKESARLFTHPSLFLRKTIDDVQKIDTSFLNRLLFRLHLPSLRIGLPERFRFSYHINEIPSRCSKLLPHLEKIAQNLDEDYYPKVSEAFKKRVPTETQYIFNDLQYLLRAAGGAVCRSVESFNNELREAKSRILLLTSRAGQGKTNFVCDFAERFLLLRGLPCLLITGREFRNVPAGNLDTYIVRLVMGANFDGTLEDFLRLAGEICAEINTPFTIIFDGINEHSQIPAFATELERLIERLVDFPFVKIILTCRSEYFSERFANLREASFGGEIYLIQEIQRAMSRRHRYQMQEAYFKFFKIKPGYMSGKVTEILCADPLLLRFFCEAYSDPQSTKPLQLPSMPDIYREVVFRRYLDKKLKEVSDRQQVGSGVGVSYYHAYKEVLGVLVSTMINKRTYSDIPISNLDTQYHPALYELITEDVFVRKDIIQGKSVLDIDAEVINFTFDEFRDYLLADHLLYVAWNGVSSAGDFANLVRELTDKTCPVAEGISRYLFYALKKSGDKDLSMVLKGMPWYDDVFLDCIFSVEDSYVGEDDVIKIRDAFIRATWVAEEIVFSLMVRWDTGATPRLNIDVLFEILDSLTEDQYNTLIQPIFDSTFSRYGFATKPRYEIRRLVSDIKDLASEAQTRWNLKYEKLPEFLVYLFPIRDESYSFPAFELYFEFAKKHPERALSLLEAHIHTNLSAVAEKIWEMLAEMTGVGVTMPKSLIESAIERLSNGSKGTPREKAEIGRFLKSCKDRFSVDFPEEVLKNIPTRAY